MIGPRGYDRSTTLQTNKKNCPIIPGQLHQYIKLKLPLHSRINNEHLEVRRRTEYKSLKPFAIPQNKIEQPSNDVNVNDFDCTDNS
jgi:hypothetical protein